MRGFWSSVLALFQRTVVASQHEVGMATVDIEKTMDAVPFSAFQIRVVGHVRIVGLCSLVTILDGFDLMRSMFLPLQSRLLTSVAKGATPRNWKA